jgi:hypothetical protein
MKKDVRLLNPHLPKHLSQLVVAIAYFILTQMQSLKIIWPHTLLLLVMFPIGLPDAEAISSGLTSTKQHTFRKSVLFS